MIPNLDAEIIPHKSIAGITLGLDFDHFKANSDYQIIKDYAEVESANSENRKWLILYRNEVLPWGDPINEIYCFWDRSITLTFNANTKRLEFIYVSKGYQGISRDIKGYQGISRDIKGYQGILLGLLGIGDRLDSAKDQYNFYFEGDKHYLEHKEYSDKVGEIIPVEIETNYRTAYSEEYSDQIIEGFLVYLLPEERGHVT